MKKFAIAATLWIFSFSFVYANPTFYFDESDTTVVDNIHSVELFIDTDGSPITAAQTIITVPTSVLIYQSELFSYYPWPEYDAGTMPNCTHSLLPPDWSLPYKSSPYIDIEGEGNTYHIACGFTGGYTTQGSGGDKIASINFTADEVGSASFSFDSINTKFYYIGSLIGPGAMSSYSVTVQPAIEPTPGPGEIPDKATDSISESDLNFVEISLSGSSTTTGTQSSGEVVELEVVDIDDTIPIPPDDLPQRPIPTPFQSAQDQIKSKSDLGEVLSAQSLRELLIPGKSSADKTVVLFNFISILLFLLILAIVIWRLISIKRLNKIKSRHMASLVSSELASLESKIELSTDDASDQALKSDISETIKKISDESI